MKWWCLIVVAMLAACDRSSVETAVGGAGMGDAGGAWTLDNYCERVAPRWCDALRPCCEESSGIGYDPEGCAQRWTEEVCEPTVAAARAGRLTFTLAAFSPEAADADVDDCIDLWAQHFARCQQSSFYDAVLLRAELNRRCNAFDGTVGFDAPCRESVECGKSYGAGFVHCYKAPESADGTCQLTYEWSSSSCYYNSWSPCAVGSHCATEDFESGTCAVDTPLGEPCEVDPLNNECGTAARCDLEQGVCVAGRGGHGAPCAGWVECQSVACIAGSCLHPSAWREPFPERWQTVNRWTCERGPAP